MNKFIQFMEEKFIPVANKISRIKALQAVSGGSMSLLGVIMVGAIFSVLTSITWAPYQNFLKATHLLTIINFVPSVTTDLLAYLWHSLLHIMGLRFMALKRMHLIQE